MGKYDSHARERTRDERERRAHPIWRGVGFALAVLIPIVSYAGSIELIKANRKFGWLPMPTDLVARPGDFLYSGDPWVYLKIALTIIIMFVLYVLFMLITFAVNKATLDPARTDPFYVPPIKAKVRKRAR